MTPEQWREVKAIFDEAVERSPASRVAFLRERCGGDDELRKEVESLLASDTATGSLLENPLLRSTSAAPEISVAAADDDTFGPYMPVRVLGEGGMGTVYLAHQQHPISREVALKVVKLGMDSRQVLERFEIERQALAVMDCPNVARVLDAGTSGRGRPYFVMEYVDGIPITQYCDQHALSTRERLKLFIPVCQAIQHAHKKGIIHRDVKPSNILVAEHDGEPVPKVIDFGIARATDRRRGELESFTVAGQIIGTPEYMSPEQASLDSRDIDTSTDVYSLGIVLYELLVGALPLDLKMLRKRAFAEVLRVIRETPTPKPTARITQMGSEVEGVARFRNTDPGQLRRDLSGDVDCIVMKAIDKDRHCRYGSASEFAADIERYLRHDPVLAGPPGAAYRVRKFVVRHKGPVVAASAIVVALIAGIITTTWQAHVAQRERAVAIAEKAEAETQRQRAEQQAIEAARQRDAADAARKRAAAAEAVAQKERNAAVGQKRRADSEAAIAAAVNEFLQDDVLALASAYSQARADATPDPDLKVRVALDRAAENIGGKFKNEPAVEASIRLTIGRTYRRLGQYDKAQREIEAAYNLSARAFGDEDPKSIEALTDLGWVYYLQGGYTQARLILLKAVEFSRPLLGEGHPTTLAAMNSLAMTYRMEGHYPQAQSLMQKVLETSRRTLGEQHPATLEAMNNLGLIYRLQGNTVEAESLFVKTLEILRKTVGAEHPDTLAAMANLGGLYMMQGQYDAAEQMVSRAAEISRRVLGADHPNTKTAEEILQNIVKNRSKAPPRTDLNGALDAVQTRRLVNGTLPVSSFGPFRLTVPLANSAAGDPTSRISMANAMAAVNRRSGKYQEADRQLRFALDLNVSAHGLEHLDTLRARLALGELRLVEQQYDSAEPLLREAWEGLRKLADEWEVYYAECLLGGALAGLRKFAEAEPLLVSGYAGLRQREASIPVSKRSAITQAGDLVVGLYQRWGKPASAAEWRAKVKQNR